MSVGKHMEQHEPGRSAILQRCDSFAKMNSNRNLRLCASKLLPEVKND